MDAVQIQVHKKKSSFHSLGWDFEKAKRICKNNEELSDSTSYSFSKQLFSPLILWKAQTSSTPHSETTKNTMWKMKHGKTFVPKHLISCSLSSKSFSIWGLSSAQENTLCIIQIGNHSEIPLCLAQQRSTGLKISPQQCVIFCVISMGPPGMCICL